jgi:hypothetical protein
LTGSDVLYTKGAEWSYEREWRMVRPLTAGTDMGKGIVCFDVPADAVRNIIFGCRTTSELQQKIRDCVAANPALRHVPFKHAKLGEGRNIEIVDFS